MFRCSNNMPEIIQELTCKRKNARHGPKFSVSAGPEFTDKHKMPQNPVWALLEIYQQTKKNKRRSYWWHEVKIFGLDTFEDGDGGELCAVSRRWFAPLYRRVNP